MTGAPDAVDPQPAAQVPSIRRRLAAMLYEALLLFGVGFIAAYLFSALLRYQGGINLRFAFQIYMLVVIGIYFVWCWRHGGQTLPMKTWKFRLTNVDGTPVSLPRAWLRYSLAWVSIPSIFGLVYAVFDRDRQFLHDRLAGTRLVRV